ncbi:OLC1v1012750C1 [Oldenlandia corymbosa var. corymbosa]|uniref:OLC1v1012750C1 n=1 Tax=Oldenlandia corymbosa var. corymbosa TaxID=529605 RepID=A0AAV1DWL2_OLDCO|nr:OLC1v1012750C1 [Oldenlandia corymbosa var. corymbosa]
MADAAIGVITGAVLKMAISLAGEELSLSLGIKKELRKLAEKLQMIEALLSDAQSRQVTSEAVRLWLKKLGSITLDAQIVLDDFGYQVLHQKIKCQKRDKVRNWFSSSNPVFLRLEMAHEIKNVLSSLDELFVLSNEIGLQAVQLVNSLPDLKDIRSTVPYVEDSKIVGREDDVLKMMNMLIGHEYEEDLPVITILGMGGQGKTTLAQLIYKNDKVKSHFERVIWVCVSVDCCVQRLLGEMLQSLTGRSHELTNVEALVNELKDKLRGRRYLLVLDDVWDSNADLWSRMRTCLLEIDGSRDSKVLVTTRSEYVASAMRTSECHQLQKLSEDQSWLLFEKCAFAKGGARNTPQVMEVGKMILRRCGGVPLAIKTGGGLLYHNNSEAGLSMIERSNWWSTDGGENIVLSTIKLSYDNLPSLPVKQCFANCAIFEKGTSLRKDSLIELWMAQGLLTPPEGSNLQMEDMGEIYFNILLRNSLFQDARKICNTEHCQMHDLVHDVLLQVSGQHCQGDWKVESNEIRAVYLSVTSDERATWNSVKYAFPSKLQTLRLKGLGLGLSDLLFENLKRLSVLIIEIWDVKTLPNSIGKMKHLRLVDVSRTSVKQLPKSFTLLYYLQTLRVRDLKHVPKGFMNLINLRHIHLEDSWMSEVLFPGLSKLRNLQTLPYFKVSRSKGFQIEELEHLDNLRGTLKILSLQNVRNHESALKSNLSKKFGIQTLELNWEKREEECDDIDVIEGLKPHPNLKSLKINGYQSSRFPSWMMPAKHLLHLCNLVSLTLKRLGKCERLPSLGDLPCLEHLIIQELTKLKCIEKEFYGWSSNLERMTKGNSSNSSGIITVFPALKSLELCGMDSFVEWSNATEIIPPMHPSSSSSLSSSSSSIQVKAFPQLKNITIVKLPRLTLFPYLGILPSLEELYVSRCNNLTISSRNWNMGSRRFIQGLDIDNQRDSSRPIDSEDIQDCYFPSLRRLHLFFCDNFTKPFCSLIKSWAPLETLSIICHPNSVPKEDLHHLTSLETLKLEAVENDEELDCYPWPNDNSSFVSLKSLHLCGFNLQRVARLPDEMQYLPRLATLTITGFDGLEALPDWIGNLGSLETLRIEDCKSIKQLPVEAFQRLANLRAFTIDKCPLLQERCIRVNGSEWPRIAKTLDPVDPDVVRWGLNVLNQL